LDGQVSSPNHRFWSTEPPKEVAERPLHSQKCTAWCSISAQWICGPIWVEDGNGLTATVTAARYRGTLGRFWNGLQTPYRDRPDQLRNQWFQQDQWYANRAVETMLWSRDRFQGHLIAKGECNEWHPHSPDLTPPDFFLWGHLKFQVCKNCPKTIAELKKAMELAVRRIPVARCRAAMEAARDWAELCLRQNGSHFEDVLQMGD